MITRRCTERMFVLGADDRSAEAFSYCLAEAAARFGILVHAAVVMSNHLHLIVTDVHGMLPRFSHLFFNQLAKATNARTGHTESVFARGDRYHGLELLSTDAIACKIAYLIGNPAKAGLVETRNKWPGFITSVKDMLEYKVYHASVGDNPYLQARKDKVLPLQITPPPSVTDIAAFAANVTTQLDSLEEHYRKERQAGGRSVKGALAVRAEKWFRKPKSGVRLFQMNPALAERVKSIRVAAIVALKRFRAAYREALQAFRGGKRNVRFPAGTWWMRVTLNASVAPFVVSA
jgi:putative transposase